VESISVAQTLVIKKRQRIDPDQELIGLGTVNLGAAFTGGFPVAGGFFCSVVNFDAGQKTPAAGILTLVSRRQCFHPGLHLQCESGGYFATWL